MDEKLTQHHQNLVQMIEGIKAFNKFKAIVKKYEALQKDYPTDTKERLFKLFTLFKEYVLPSTLSFDSIKETDSEFEFSSQTLFDFVSNEKSVAPHVQHFNQAIITTINICLSPLLIEEDSLIHASESASIEIQNLRELIQKEIIYLTTQKDKLQLEQAAFYIKKLSTILLSHTQKPFNTLATDTRVKVDDYFLKASAGLSYLDISPLKKLHHLLSQHTTVRCEEIYLQVKDVLTTIQEKLTSLNQNLIPIAKPTPVSYKPSIRFSLSSQHEKLSTITKSLARLYPQAIFTPRYNTLEIAQDTQGVECSYFLDVYNAFYKACTLLIHAQHLSSFKLFEKANVAYTIAIAKLNKNHSKTPFSLISSHIEALKSLFESQFPYPSSKNERIPAIQRSLLALPPLWETAFLAHPKIHHINEHLKQKVNAFMAKTVIEPAAILESIINDCFLPLLSISLDFERCNDIKPGELFKALYLGIQHLHQSLAKQLMTHSYTPPAYCELDKLIEALLNPLTPYASDTNRINNYSALKQVIRLIDIGCFSIKEIQEAYLVAQKTLGKSDAKYNPHFLKINTMAKLPLLRADCLNLFKEIEKKHEYKKKQQTVLKKMYVENEQASDKEKRREALSNGPTFFSQNSQKKDGAVKTYQKNEELACIEPAILMP